MAPKKTLSQKTLTEESRVIYGVRIYSLRGTVFVCIQF